MSYSTPQSVRLALVPSSDGSLPAQPTNTAADLSDPQLTDAIAEADSIINGYLASIYVTPVALTTDPTPIVPHPVDYWSRDIAAYLATASYRGQMDIQSTDPVALRYAQAMSMLKDVSAGKMILPLPRLSGDTVGLGAADAPINPYIGDLWQPQDFVTVEGSLWHSPHWGWNR